MKDETVFWILFFLQFIIDIGFLLMFSVLIKNDNAFLDFFIRLKKTFEGSERVNFDIRTLGKEELK